MHYAFEGFNSKDCGKTTLGRKLHPRRVIGRQQIDGRNRLEMGRTYEGNAQDLDGLEEACHQDMPATTKTVVILVARICGGRLW